MGGNEGVHESLSPIPSPSPVRGGACPALLFWLRLEYLLKMFGTFVLLIINLFNGYQFNRKFSNFVN